MMKSRGASGHFQTMRTDFSKPQTPWDPSTPAIETAAAPKTEPVRFVLPRPKKSKFQKNP